MKFTWVWIIILCIILTSCSKKSPDQNSKGFGGPPKEMKANAFVVSTRALNENLVVPGSILAFEESEIHPEISGKIISLNIVEGKSINKGNLLAKIYDEDLQAQLKKLKVQLQIAQNNEKRQSELLQVKAIGQQEYDANLLEVNNLRADIDILQTNIRKTEIRAPFDGRIGFKNISLGSYVTPQTILTKISQVNKLKLEFSVPEKYINILKLGQNVRFTSANSSKEYIATIYATESTVEADTRSLKIRALINKQDVLLTPGAFAEVKLNMNAKAKAIMVPSQAIIPQAREKVIIIYKNGLVNFQTVTIGFRDSSNVEVLTGVNSGDTVLISGLMAIKPDSKVKLSSISK
jgi:membrane fusion protein (multidrug efflux system)